MDKNLNKIYSESVSNLDKDDILDRIMDRLNSNSMYENVNSDNMTTGTAAIDNRLFLISKSGITTTDKKSEFNGYLVMIRELDGSFIKIN